jgi:TonB family protein
MRLLTGTMIGQSRGEFVAAVSFSLVIHVVVISTGLFLSLYVRPRVSLPPSYQVKLVDLPADASRVHPSMTGPPAAPPPAPKQKHPPAPKAAKAKPAPAPRPAAAPKQAMPELAAEKPKKEPAAAEPQTEAPAKKQEAVSVSSGSQEFHFPPYVAIVRDRVERNWNPPPGAKGAKVKVLFRILRSGRVGEARLAESSGNFYFDQAAMRAILSSSPFPALPESFFKDSEVFSVDLMEKE